MTNRENEIKALQKWYARKYEEVLDEKTADKIIGLTYRYGARLFNVAYDLIMRGWTNECGLTVELDDAN